MATLNEAWQQLARRIPVSAGHRQRRDMELAFYSGMCALAEVINALPALGNDARSQVAEALGTELDDFRVRMLGDILGSIFDCEPTPHEQHSRFTTPRTSH